MRAIPGRFLAAGAWDGGRGRGDAVGVGEDGRVRWRRRIPLHPWGTLYPDSKLVALKVPPASVLDTSSFFPDVTCLLWLFSRLIIRTVSYLSSFLK